MLRKIFIFICLSFSACNFAQNYGGNYDWRMLGGGPLQVVSLHLGMSSNISHNNEMSYSIGGSLGWNYLSSFYNLFNSVEHVFDMGIRIKYNFAQNRFKTHNVGAELYLHFPYSTTNVFKHVPQPISLIIGAGGAFLHSDANEQTKLNGYYFEAGIGVVKFFPLNVNFLYRWSFFPNNSSGILPVEQSLHIDFTIF